MYILAIDTSMERCSSIREYCRKMGYEYFFISCSGENSTGIYQLVGPYLQPPDPRNSAIVLIQAAWSLIGRDAIDESRWEEAEGISLLHKMMQLPKPINDVRIALLGVRFIPAHSFPRGWGKIFCFDNPSLVAAFRRILYKRR